LTASANLPDWNNFGRVQASQKWRRQSAAMGSGFTRAIVDAAQAAPRMSVLDIACGTGEPAISIATLLNGTGAVTGIDISPGPLRTAEERAAQRELSNTRFRQADVHELPFPDNSFDRVTSRLGVMFFTDLPRALREIHRVLKPGGRLALLAWGPMEQPYFQTTIGTILKVLPGATPPDAANAMFAFGKPAVLGQALREAGFADVEESFPVLPWTWPGTPEEVWEYFQEVTVPFAPLLREIPASHRAQVDLEVLRAISHYYDGAEIKFTATANICCASKLQR
jgi:ubiquinone/menaquinone biosynthesis C-methylase UbiE